MKNRLHRSVLLACAAGLACTAPLALWAQAQPSAKAAPVAQMQQAHADWVALAAHEKWALSPLAGEWGKLTPTQREKWLTIARQFDRLPANEQQTMQQRMQSWATLSPTQRSQARLNFNLTQDVSKDEKKSRWDEYQALSEAEKQKLSSGRLAPARTTAPTRNPQSAERLVQPTVRSMPSQALPARQPVDPKTLLPAPAADTPASDSALDKASAEPAS